MGVSSRWGRETDRASGGPIVEADTHRGRKDCASVILSLLRRSDLFDGAQSAARLRRDARCYLTDSSRRAHVFARRRRGGGWAEGL